MPEIQETAIEREMQSSYIDYAMSVIVGRALPEARDGLKPAQRRILYAMYRLNNTHDQPTKKSARIVGETIGKYHPHGDMAVYDTLVRMAQDFSMNHTLVEGQGNMGSIDGDPPAAQRYTEVRLTRLAEEMLDDIEKQSVPFIPNFDNTEQEPVLLPAKVPNLLLNGASGIAVGVATNIMPHNLSEVCDAIVAYVDNQDITSEELLKHVKGPDFPTGGTVFYTEALIASYTGGRGSVTIRGKTLIEKVKNRNTIIITEIPYTVNKAALVQNIAELVRSKRIQGISDLRDESGKEGVRVVIDLRQEVDPNYILNMLYKHTQLEISMPVMNIAVIGNNLVTLNLKHYLKTFVDHRLEVIKKRTTFDLNVATDRLHIVEGLLIAVDDIDSVVAIIKKSSDTKEARASLISNYKISDKQANAILDMRLGKLTNLETGALETEKSELTSNISRFNDILSSADRMYQIIKSETKQIKEKYSAPRRTLIEYNVPKQEINREDLIVDEETTVILTNNNYIKRLQTKVYKAQERGGKGIIAIGLKEGDFAKQMISCMLKDYLLMLSNKGRAYWLKAYLVPEESRYSFGKAIINLVKLSDSEKIETVINTKSFSGSFLSFVTKKGKIKRVNAEKFSRPRANGIKAMPLLEGDELADICLSDGKSELFIATRRGKSLRFKESDIRPMGRGAYGIRGIKLNSNDAVANMVAVKENELIASISDFGYGKVSEINKYRLQKRGGKGVINVKVKEKIGQVVRALKVRPDGNVILINSLGLSIKFPVANIRVTGRSASGVRLMRLDPGAKIVDAQTV